MPVHTSVPPLPTLSSTSGPNCSATQRKPSGGQRAAGGADLPQPGQVELLRRLRRPPCGRPSGTRGWRPSAWRRSPRRAATASAGPGAAGCRRSARSTRRPAAPDTSAFHIIQAVVENHSIRSPGPRSQLRAWFFRCSSRIPPWQCTIAFGLPVVPEENSTHSGCVERHRLEGQRRPARRAVRPSDTLSGSGVRAVGHVHDVRARSAGRRGSRRPRRGGRCPWRRSRSPAIGQQHGGLDLAEPVDHAARAELRGAARPDRAQARGGQERHQRLGDVRQVGRPPGRPGRHPSRCSPARARATWSRSCPQVSSTAVPGLRVARCTATSSGVLTGRRTTACSA